MTTYIICPACGKKFKSPIQVANLKSNISEDNTTECPHCGKQITFGNENMINE